MSINHILESCRWLTTRARIPMVGFALLASTACESSPPRMLSEQNALFVVEDALWAEVEDTMVSALKPKLVGLPREVTYRIIHQPPAEVSDANLRRFRHIVVLAHPADSVAAEVLRSTSGTSDPLPALLQSLDLWATGQRVTLVTLPENGALEVVLEHVDTIAALLDRDYREWTRVRMYSNGLDPELSSDLASEGIALRVPAPYRQVLADDSVRRFVTFGNDQDPLVRSLLVAWSPLDEDPPAAESVLERRQSLAARFYEDAQVIQPGSVQELRLEAGTPGLEVRGVWQGTMDGQLHAGPFVSRTIDCADQNRRYFLDAWAYAPSRGKYAYLIQLEALLDSFGCSAGIAPPRPEG